MAARQADAPADESMGCSTIRGQRFVPGATHGVGAAESGGSKRAFVAGDVIEQSATERLAALRRRVAARAAAAAARPGDAIHATTAAASSVRQDGPSLVGAGIGADLAAQLPGGLGQLATAESEAGGGVGACGRTSTGRTTSWTR